MVTLGELFDELNAAEEAAAGEPAAFCVLWQRDAEELVGGDAEGGGETSEDGGLRPDLVVLVARDEGLDGADLLGERGLSEAPLLAEELEAKAEGRGLGLGALGGTAGHRGGSIRRRSGSRVDGHATNIYIQDTYGARKTCLTAETKETERWRAFRRLKSSG